MPPIEVIRERFHAFRSRPGWHRDDGVTSQITDCLSMLVSEHGQPEQTYEEQIYFIFETLECRVHPEQVANAIGCSTSYAYRFDYDAESGCAFEKDWSKQNQESKVSPGQRNRILRRDHEGCLRCRAGSSLEIHHIIPVSAGGPKEDDNLATLCENCHIAAHGGSKTTSNTVYADRDSFMDWLATDPKPSETIKGQGTLSDFQKF